MRIDRRAAAVLGATMLAVAWVPALALSTDRDEPIEIEARSAEADNRKRVTIYRGDVVITQGTLRITGDTVWVHYDDDNTITKAISEGRPAIRANRRMRHCRRKSNTASSSARISTPPHSPMPAASPNNGAFTPTTS